MALKPIALDHVNIYVRNAERAHRWYVDVLGLHTQDIARVPETGRVRGVFLACDENHAHDIALFDAGEEAEGPQLDKQPAKPAPVAPPEAAAPAAPAPAAAEKPAEKPAAAGAEVVSLDRFRKK